MLVSNEPEPHCLSEIAVVMGGPCFCLIFPALDQNSLQDSACALEDHGLQEPLSSGIEVVPPADQQVQTPPAPVHHSPVSPAPGHRVVVTTEEDILSGYVIGRMLGKRGFSSIYEGKLLEDGLEVAVKIARKPGNMEYINIICEVFLVFPPMHLLPAELLDWQDQLDQYIMVLERPSPCKDLWDFTVFH